MGRSSVASRYEKLIQLRVVTTRILHHVLKMLLGHVWLPALPPTRLSWAKKNVFGCKQGGLARIRTNLKATHSLACWERSNSRFQQARMSRAKSGARL